MPVYFFHVSFGNRLLPDEEGTELHNRVAAREEAFAVARDLAHRVTGYGRRHWGNWSLVVADAEGPFLRIPIAPEGPAVVTPGVVASTTEQFTPSGTLPAVSSVRLGSRIAVLMQQVLVRKQATLRLMEKQRMLRDQLSGQLALSQQVRGQVDHALARARRVGSAFAAGIAVTHEEPSGRPHLTLLPGGKI
jgi:hypothetical protein